MKTINRNTIFAVAQSNRKSQVTEYKIELNISLNFLKTKINTSKVTDPPNDNVFNVAFTNYANRRQTKQDTKN